MQSKRKRGVTQNQLDELKRIIDSGIVMTGKDMAERTGIAKTTVQNILKGKRGWNPTTTSIAKKDTYEQSINYTENGMEKCHTCGGYCVLPCLLCSVRAKPKAIKEKEHEPNRNEVEQSRRFPPPTQKEIKQRAKEVRATWTGNPSHYID